VRDVPTAIAVAPTFQIDSVNAQKVQVAYATDPVTSANNPVLTCADGDAKSDGSPIIYTNGTSKTVELGADPAISDHNAVSKQTLNSDSMNGQISGLGGLESASSTFQTPHGTSHSLLNEAFKPTDFNFAFDGQNGTIPHVIPASELEASASLAQLPLSAEAGLHLPGTPASTIIASTPAAQTFTSGDSFVFEPNFRHDVVTNSGVASNASLETPHGSSHNLPNDAFKATDSNFAFDGPNGTPPHEPVVPASEIDASVFLTQLPPSAEANLHLKGTPASAIIASTPAAQMFTILLSSSRISGMT
jgi:hypothetical protein